MDLITAVGVILLVGIGGMLAKLDTDRLWSSASSNGNLHKNRNRLYRIKKTDVLDLPKYDWFEIGYKFYFIVKRKYLNKMTKREKFSFISDILRKGRPIRADGFIYNIATHYISNDRVIIETEEMSGISETLYTKEIKNNG